MRRKKRLLFAAKSFGFLGGFIPFGAIAFNTPTDLGAGTDTTVEGATGDDEQQQPPSGAPAAPVTKPKLPIADKAIIKARDKAKAGVRSFAVGLGIDPEELEYAGSGTDDDPYEIANLTELLDAAGVNRGKGNKKAVIDDAAKAKIAAPFKRKMEAAEAERDALRRFIAQNYIANEIRAEARKNNAYDDGTGQYSALVRLIRPFFVPQVAYDPDTKTASVELAGINPETNEAIESEDGTAYTIASAVQKELNENKNLRSSSVRGGPGAGGITATKDGTTIKPRNGVPASQQVTADEATAEELDKMFPAGNILRI